MNKKITITILIIITITISSITYSTTNLENVKNEDSLQNEENVQITSILDRINQDKIKNDNSEKKYIPTDREWVKIGPFEIDRTQYALGEKIFININNMPENMKGELRFTKIINATHDKVYKNIQFDGLQKQVSKFYVGMYPSVSAGFCNSEDMIGDWEIIFSGTELVSHKFKITEVIVPGLEDSFEPVC